ncbi:hypothetical protein SLS60_007348 [Paraconiothyrium brasiliense]|uniref:ubiquitinyl hydrolase 1 n=1 Tax=Paraconiothyrium brasiliense TaxID=300254 RepID=A0ABR3R538_9PLEO
MALPQADDAEPANEQAMFASTIAALRELRSEISDAEPVLAQKFDSPIAAVSNLLLSYNEKGYVTEQRLVKSLRKLITTNNPATFPLQVKAQNSAIIMRRVEDNILFEVFELSPQDEQVMKAKGRLIRAFPTHACRIHRDRLLEDGLLEALARHIAKLSCNEVPEFCFGGVKTGTNQGTSDTSTHPGLVTGYLVSVLTALGGPTTTNRIQKNTREEVIHSSTGSPWRRSPLWLLVRVVLQLEFARSIDSQPLATAVYKAAIATVLAKILVQADVKKIDPELLYATSVKIARRLRKLKSMPLDLYPMFANPIRSILIGVHRRLDGVWDDILNRTDSYIDMGILPTLHPQNDTLMQMNQLDRFLERISSRQPQATSSTYIPTSECPEFDDVELLFVFDVAGELRYSQLSIVERWVKENLSSWLETHKYEKKSCLRLSRLITDYHRAADCLYTDADTPSGLSLMYITIAELWIACDTCACAMYPMLADYSPETDFSILRSLSLPFKSQMERLLAIERYARTRGKRANVTMPSVFRQFGDYQSFAVRYFDTSEPLQALRDKIERDATNKQQQKTEELSQMIKDYQQLISRSDKLTCENHETVYKGRGRKRKAVDVSRKCRKCQLRAEAERMCIAVHEWPLHSSESVAKATIFELNIPESYSHWRDATVCLLKDVFLFALDKDTTSSASSHTLERYDGLNPFRKGVENQRIRIYSRKQPSLGTLKYIKDGVMFLTDADVCVDNDLSYRYYDYSDKFAMGKLHLTEKVQQKCTYQAPSRSPQLQRYLNSTVNSDDGTPNSAMASVSGCPHHLSMDEYKSLNLLPLGNKVLYLNILTQLRAPVVDFTKVEAHCLVYQIVHMAGPPTISQNDATYAVPRETHSILREKSFCQALLQELNDTLEKTKGNWETWRALSTCVLLALRMLAFTEDAEILSSCFDFLTTVRQIAIGWICALDQRLRIPSDSAQRAELLCKKTEIALLCISTFDVDIAHIEHVLHYPSAVSVLLQMSIIVRENKDAVSSDHGFLYRATIQSWRNILFRFSPLLSDGLTTGRFEPDLNSAVRAAWTNFEPRGNWEILSEPKHHWAHIKSGHLDVHFNFLTAALLVSGLPLARLPDEYTEHETYLALFNGIPIEVMPTEEEGMAFSAKHTYFGCKLSFGMNNKRDHMLVIAEQGGQKLDLIPQRVFQNILPDAFVDRYFHWYNHNTKNIEFRPLDKPWSPDGGLWRLKKSGLSWILENETSYLVCPGSKTGTTLAAMLAPVEHQPHIHIMVNKQSSLVSIALVRLRLDFYLSPGSSSIHSCQYNGKIIDSSQRIGTLAGLASKLVLREEHKNGNRTILIPEGTIKYSKSFDHILVSVEPDTTTRIHDYHFDEILLRLEDNGTLQSKLLLCYLHALTSHFMVDRATCCTGTEASLKILRSAAVSSFGKLDLENVELLSSIAQLTPVRKYGTSVKSTQQVHWDEQLPSFSQHGSFFIEVDRLFRQTQKHSLLYAKNLRIDIPKLKSVQLDLLIRDSIRSAAFRIDEFGAEQYSRAYDSVYTGRHVTLDPNRSQRSASITTMLLKEEVALVVGMENLQLSLHSRHLKNSKVQGPSPLEPESLGFSTEWFNRPACYLPKLWCSLHASLSASPNRFNKFTVIMFLSILAFAESADMDIIQALAAFYREAGVASIAMPGVSEFDLSKGNHPELGGIENIVRGNRRLYDNCPESRLVRRLGETWDAWNSRKLIQFHRNQTNAINAFASAVHAQWPSEELTKPDIQNANTYINTDPVMAVLQVKFKAWYSNHLFYLYTQNVADALGRMAVSDVPTICKQPNWSPEQYANRESNGSFGVREIFGLPPPLPANTMVREENAIHWPEKPILDVPIEDSTTRRPRRNENSLNRLCNDLERVAASPCEKQYVADLRDSQKSLGFAQRRVRILTEEMEGDLRDTLQTYLRDCQRYVRDIGSVLRSVVASGDETAWAIDHLPRITPGFWLQQLHRDRYDLLSPDWKKAMIIHGLAFTEVHRARRLLSLLDNDPSMLPQELAHEGHQNWNPTDYPETLLLEVEGGFLVREVQEDIAKHMRDPHGGRNAVLQLNCGEGKSSVIVPMVAAALSDKKR